MSQLSNVFPKGSCTLAYVVGENYSELARLPGVLTSAQFFKAVLNDSLPLNMTWKLGQGLNSVEKSLLKLCQSYRSEIQFHGFEEETVSENNQNKILPKHDCPKSILAKVRQLVMILMNASRKSANRLNLLK